MTDDTKQDGASEGQSASKAQLELINQPELVEAIVEMAKNSVPIKYKTEDETVWLHIFCSVASAFNSSTEQSAAWADTGLSMFRTRFRS
jgi:hypothetical protein